MYLTQLAGTSRELVIKKYTDCIQNSWLVLTLRALIKGITSSLEIPRLHVQFIATCRHSVGPSVRCSDSSSSRDPVLQGIYHKVFKIIIKVRDDGPEGVVIYSPEEQGNTLGTYLRYLVAIAHLQRPVTCRDIPRFPK